MDTSNIIALALGGISLIVSVVGFVITPRINLKSKKLEKRLEYRFVLFQKILELWEHVNSSPSPDQSKLISIMSEINKLIQLHGYNSEITAFEELRDAYSEYVKNQNTNTGQRLTTKLSEFFSIAFNAYRKEIVLERLRD
ncbi:MAG: hypothetical protein KF900_06625 [Bacteroidetes bacterium]|nr:hypothetical protein [Bacteroidota bacterium]